MHLKFSLLLEFLHSVKDNPSLGRNSEITKRNTTYFTYRHHQERDINIDFRKVDDKTGEFQNFLQVYGKHGQPCPTCGTPIQRAVQQQRSSFYCSVCQN